MAPRVHTSGRLVNASAGRVHITRYPAAITLDVARASQDDYVAHYERIGRTPAPLVIIPEIPLPLPGIDVRTYWRETTKEPGFESIALILTGVVGLMAATVTHFSEQLVGVLDVNIRSFKNGDDAAYWLTGRFDCEIDEFDLMDVIDEVLAVGPSDS